MDKLLYLNPYSGTDFFGFIFVFFKRLIQWITGHGDGELYADEVQLFMLFALSISCSLIGTFLILRRKTMLANALSHTMLFGIVVAFLLLPKSADTFSMMSMPFLLLAGGISALITSLCTEFLHQKTKISEDASIGLVFTLLFALGIILLTLFARSTHLGVELVMGNLDALQRSDLIPACMMMVGNLLLFVLFFKEYKVSSFDPSFAHLHGLFPKFFHYLLMVQTSLIAVTAFQAVGFVMVLMFFVAPSLIARLFTKRLKPLLVFSITLSCAASFFGIALSRHLLTMTGIGLSSAGIVVTLLFFTFIFSIAVLSFRRLRLAS